MINADMRLYDYYLLTEKDAYGQEQITDKPQGQIKMAINLTSHSVKDNIKYSEASFIGLTMAEVDDTYIIDYNGSKLKVLYVSPKGRYKQVYLNER